MVLTMTRRMITRLVNRRRMFLIAIRPTPISLYDLNYRLDYEKDSEEDCPDRAVIFPGFARSACNRGARLP